MGRILILGATGRTGKWVLQKALEDGYAVNVLVRDSSKITEQSDFSIFEGNPQVKQDVEKAVVGCDAIISVLNISRTSDFPWSKLRTPRTFLSDTIKTCIEVAEDCPIKRIIVCSAWGVAETNADLPFWFRLTIKYSNIGVAYADHERQEKLLKESNLDWTIVRPVGLLNSKKLQNIRVTFENNPKPKLTIGRKSLAIYMIKALKDTTLIRQVPTLSED